MKKAKSHIAGIDMVKRLLLAALAAAAVSLPALAADEPELVWVFASRGHIPKGSLAAGKGTNGDALYVCRARLANGSEQPGRIREPMLGCAIMYGGLEWSIGAYQVLRDDGPKLIKWVNAKESPKGAYAVGREADGTVLHLCRATLGDGSALIGKLAAGSCHYGVGGKEQNTSEFEVLVKP
ncbi:MAG TPA: DM9 repeat-containing protein [Burkholderiales bacterium]|nr:DM9 repeat-containing protein [Burkholderiales bacterium]